MLTNLINEAAKGTWGAVDSLLILKDNKLVLESYFRGNQWDKPHELRSLTKSLLSAGYGAAVSLKLIPSVDVSVYEVFEHASRFDNPHPEKRLMTFAHVMTMTAGLACEDMSSPTNPCGSRLFASTMPWQSKLEIPIWQRALNLPLANMPGTVFAYNDAAPVIIDGLLSGLAHRETTDFLRMVLFRPMKIGDRSSLFRLTSRDLIKFGQLYLSGGAWNGKRLLPKSWVEESTSVKWQFAGMPPGTGYGYFWWISGVDINGKREKIFYALGNGGQAIFVVPTLQLVFVTTATNFDRYDLFRGPLEMLKQFVIPAFSAQLTTPK
ncbi:serine hydrolase [Permianibacter sp. IMCC34836]|uniref:serine hydrolase domain-containing protein n=1 Tax=Permianibacter fluminis TaxID=2738515 RepID=UPI001554243A|nr:serine hydrolase [Permianibacter fluminis]NQD36110.1 serine hydrolase [Permianibacter fluminis]